MKDTFPAQATRGTRRRSRDTPSDLEHGGGGDHDILNDALFTSLRQLAYRVIFAAPPFSTHSVARFYPDGPPSVRDRANISGRPDCQRAHRRELRRANEITRRTSVILPAAHSAGAEFAIDNPADRGDPAIHSNPCF